MSGITFMDVLYLLIGVVAGFCLVGAWQMLTAKSPRDYELKGEAKAARDAEYEVFPKDAP